MTSSAASAEKQVCAWALQRNDWVDAADHLSPQHFEQPAYGALWQVIQERRRIGRAVNPDALEPWASVRSDWNLDALFALVSRGATGSRADFQACAQAVIEAFETRELHLAAGDIQRILADDASLSRLDLLAMMEARLRAVRLASAANVMTIEEVVMARADRYGQSDSLGIPTGLIELDNRFGGYSKEDLILMAGRPSMGKSALLANSVLSMGRIGKRGHFASAEMSAEQVADRSLSAASWGSSGGFQYRDMRSLNELRRPTVGRVREVAKAYAGLPLNYDFSSGQSLSHIRREARRTAQRFGGLDFIAVDHTHRLRGEGKERSAVERFDAIAEGLKNLAREMKVPVIAAAQLNRASEHEEDKRPTLANLRNSGAFEMEADVVVLVHRESYYLARKEPQAGAFTTQMSFRDAWREWEARMSANRGKLELHTAKQRQGEPGIDVVQFAEGYDVIQSIKEGAAE